MPRLIVSLADVRGYVNKIAVIKAYRTITGSDLLTSKRAVEDALGRGSVLSRYPKLRCLPYGGYTSV